MYSIWSTTYLETDMSSYNCYVNESIWRRITNEHISNRIFARITKGEKFWICSLGAPINTNFPEISDTPNVFVPRWMLEQLNSYGDGEPLDIVWMPSESFEESTKIILKPFDITFESTNIQEHLSNELTKLAILQKNTIIYINMPELDGYQVGYQVIHIEPSSVVLCQGDEVELEFEYSRPLTPIPLLPELLYDDNYIIPSIAPAPHVESPILGGVQHEGRFNPWRDKDFKPNIR